MGHTIIEEFQIDCTVEAHIEIDEQPVRKEECHGEHYFDDSSYEISAIRVFINIAGKDIDITDRLRAEEIKAIEDNITPNIDL